MKGLVLVVIGIAVGFFVAHTVSRTEEGGRFFAGVDTRAREFRGAVVEGYKAREAELRAVITTSDDVG